MHCLIIIAMFSIVLYFYSSEGASTISIKNAFIHLEQHVREYTLMMTTDFLSIIFLAANLIWRVFDWQTLAKSLKAL